ncbi:hypothetical protein, partial [Sphingomonas sp.]|uniref:hypothetical protein n=1 Tax=Sphingomonas sp. TaxID=28214 RepID=UPI0026012F1E
MGDSLVTNAVFLLSYSRALMASLHLGRNKAWRDAMDQGCLRNEQLKTGWSAVVLCRPEPTANEPGAA